MTEADWLACTDPAPLLELLRGKASDRKLRLFACACVRRAWPRLVHAAGRAAVEAAERYAEGDIGDREREAARAGAYETMLAHAWSGDDHAHRAALSAVSGPAWEAAFHASAGVSLLSGEVGPEPEEAPRQGLLSRIFWGDRAAKEREALEDAAQCSLLRCVVGPSLFHPVRPDPAWLAWHGGAAVELAAAVHAERELPSGHLDPARLAVLADMLEEADCTEPELLGHLRGPGPHVRGCFVLDLLLNKG
jgi:hypothetical protein